MCDSPNKYMCSDDLNSNLIYFRKGSATHGVSVVCLAQQSQRGEIRTSILTCRKAMVVVVVVKVSVNVCVSKEESVIVYVFLRERVIV